MRDWLIVTAAGFVLGLILFLTGRDTRSRSNGETAGLLVMSAAIATAFIVGLFWLAHWLRGY